LAISQERTVAFLTTSTGGDSMPTAKELSVQMNDRPGTLGKLCRVLADRGVNILAFQASSAERRSQVRLVADNPTIAKSVLDSQGLAYTEAEVVQVTLPNRTGELARVASRLSEANININSAYGGVDPVTNAPLVFFGVTEVGRAAKILDQAAAAAARP
jgi:hypothetical protein